MRMMPLAFEVQHRVDDMLQGFWTREAALLGHVSDQERGNVVALRGEQKLGGGFPHLPDTAGRRLKLQREHRLNRVDDEELGTDAT